MQDIRALDNVSFSDWFISHGGSRSSLTAMWDPIGWSQPLPGFPIFPQIGKEAAFLKEPSSPEFHFHVLSPMPASS